MLIFGSPWHLPPAWGDIPTWITAIATTGLLIGAIITARYAIKTFHEQSEQLKDQRQINAKQTTVIELQTRELSASLAERQRQARQLKRAQASKVDLRIEDRPDPGFGIIPEAVSIPTPGILTVYVTNNSDQPIYNADIIWHDGSMGYNELAVWPGAVHLAPRIGPGESVSRAKRPTDPPEADDGALRFRDAKGVAWLRTSSGHLEDFTGGPAGGWPGPDLSDLDRIPP
jgi:hypothetical protein